MTEEEHNELYEKAVDEAERLTEASLDDSIQSYEELAAKNHLLLKDPENPFSALQESLRQQIEDFKTGHFDAFGYSRGFDEYRWFRKTLAALLQTATWFEYETWTALDEQTDRDMYTLDSGYEWYSTKEDSIRGLIILQLCELLHVGYCYARESTPSRGEFWLKAFRILEDGVVPEGSGITVEKAHEFLDLFDKALKENSCVAGLEARHRWFLRTEEDKKSGLPSDLWIRKHGNGSVGKRFRLAENGSIILDVVQKIAWPRVLTGEPLAIIYELLQAHDADPAAVCPSSKSVHGKTKRLTNLFQAGRAHWTFKDAEIATPGTAHRDIKPGQWRILKDNEVKAAPRGAPWRVCTFDGTNYKLVEDPAFRPPRPASRK